MHKLPGSLSIAALSLSAGLGFASPPAQAQSEPYLGQMMLVGFNFCPRGWSTAAGQLLPISQNSALFSLLGTTYGGDGRTTFALPDLRSRVPLGVGQSPGHSTIIWGETGGRETVTLSVANLPPHSHAASTNVTVTSTVNAQTARSGNVGSPTGAVPASPSESIYSQAAPNTTMASGMVTNNATATTTIGNTGGGQPFNTEPPFLGMQWCIALQGIFPSRN